jgi:hypothetical protein
MLTQVEADTSESAGHLSSQPTLTHVHHVSADSNPYLLHTHPLFYEDLSPVLNPQDQPNAGSTTSWPTLAEEMVNNLVISDDNMASPDDLASLDSMDSSDDMYTPNGTDSSDEDDFNSLSPVSKILHVEAEIRRLRALFRSQQAEFIALNGLPEEQSPNSRALYRDLERDVATVERVADETDREMWDLVVNPPDFEEMDDEDEEDDEHNDEEMDKDLRGRLRHWSEGGEWAQGRASEADAGNVRLTIPKCDYGVESLR